MAPDGQEAPRPARPTLGLRCVTTLLFALLVVVTGTLVGGLAYANGETAMQDARSTGDRSVEQCTAAGLTNLRATARDVVRAVVRDVTGNINAFLTPPAVALNQTTRYLSLLHPNDTMNPDFVSTHLRQVIFATWNAAVDNGYLDQLSISPFLEGYNYTRGTDVGFTNLAFIGLRQGSPALTGGAELGKFLLETRDPDTGRFGMNRDVWSFGMLEDDGTFDTNHGQRLECLQPGEDPQVIGSIGICEFPNERDSAAGHEHLAALAVGDGIQPPLLPPRAVGRTPVLPLPDDLGVIYFASWAHPAMPELYPGQNRRGGFATVVVSTRFLEQTVRQQPVPAGSFLYVVEQDLWGGMLGKVIGATHGEVRNLTGAATMLAQAKSVTEYEIDTIREHGMYALGLPGGYADLEQDGDLEETLWKTGDGSWFWVHVTSVQRDGLRWFLVFLVNRDDMLSDITASTHRIEADNAKARRDSDNRVQRGLVTMLIVAAASSAVLLLLSFYLADRIAAPIRNLCTDMVNVAVMRLEMVDEQSPSSYLAEVVEMQSSFAVMVARLKKYREYMPQSVLVSDGGNDREASATTPSKSSAGSSKECLVPAPPADALRDHNLKTKNVTVLMFNVVGWHAFMSTMSDTHLIASFGDVLSVVVQTVQAYKGVTDSFSGDRVSVTFNAVTMCALHRSNAVTAGAVAREKVGVLGLTLSFSAGTGEGKMGNVGCSGVRRFTVFSTVLPWSWALESLNKSLSCKGLVDSGVHEDARHRLPLRCVGKAVLTKHRKTPVFVFEAIGTEFAEKNEEWLYTLADQQDGNQLLNHWNSAVEAVFSKDWADARASLERYEGDTTDLVYRRVSDWISKQESEVYQLS